MRWIVLLGFLMATGAMPARAAGPAVIVLLGKGAQVYGCVPAGTGFAWRLKVPDATLTDAAGRRVGRHFAGPSWQAEDGSTVTGEVLVASQAAQADAIPWLVLKAKGHSGDGMFSAVTYIVRSATAGGGFGASCERRRRGRSHCTQTNVATASTKITSDTQALSRHGPSSCAGSTRNISITNRPAVYQAT